MTGHLRFAPSQWLQRWPSVVLAAVAVLVTAEAVRKAGDAGIVAPLALALVPVLVARPTATVWGVVALVVLCEDGTFGLFPWTTHFYANLVHGVLPLDILLCLAIVGVGLRLRAEQRPVRLPPTALGIPLMLIAFALLAGVDVGRANGASLSDMLLTSHGFVYLLVLPVLVLNLDMDARALRRVLMGAGALALVKAILGLLAITTGRGVTLDGTGTTALTYYAPTANWLMMVVVLWALAVALRPRHPPRWLLLASPLILTSLILAYRRSFWIGLALGVVLVILLGLSPTGRRLFVPAVAVVAIVIGLLGSVLLPGNSPIVKRAESLNPNAVSASSVDRYRLDERANVWAEIRQQPLAGIGLGVPWSAAKRPLPLDLGRDYVHFSLLYWWLHLGILGAVAYIGLLLGGARLAWKLWRSAEEPILKAAGLGFGAALAGLATIETSGAFTGVDLRFSILLGAQLGVLAALVALRPSDEPRRPQVRDRIGLARR